ncbi:MAG: formylglycine-generating enzyme family protein [Candidatus Sumerlaeia bacterium]|nr:formylglycine-generating enzyme family protein [Candidatus Sumerlaeia bacterium]
MNDDIITRCTNCGESYYVPSSFLGKSADCEVCGAVFTIIAGTEEPLSTSTLELPFPDLSLVRIPAGRFTRGENNSFFSSSPAHEVRITRDYWISRFLVSQALFNYVMQENPSTFKGESLPVETVSWQKAQDFCYQLTKQAREQNLLEEGLRFRLPTEAEWEFALCLDSGYPEAFEPIHDYAWMLENSARTTHPVGEKLPSLRGLYDMLGNVGEWCHDWYSLYSAPSSTANAEGVLEDPRGPITGTTRVRRGGGYASIAARCRPADRMGVEPSHRSSQIGFRVVLAEEN